MILKILYTIRPSACVGAGLFACAAYQDAGSMQVISLIFASVFSGSAACFLFNDIVDRKKDLLNHKLRPVATGEISLSLAIFLVVIFTFIHLWLAWWLGAYQLLIAAIMVICFFVYPFINNHSGLPANLLVAMSVVLAFIFGRFPGLGWGVYESVLVSVFIITISREIMLDALDIKGDSRYGKPSIPVKYGLVTSQKTAFLLNVTGTFPLFIVSLQRPSWLISGLCGLGVLSVYIPMVWRLQSNISDWMLYNIRASHVYFILIIVVLFVR